MRGDGARWPGAAILATPVTATLKRVSSANVIDETISRDGLWMAQTPQVFRTKLLKEAFARAVADQVTASDEAGLIERLGHEVHVVHGTERNIKITKPADMELARFYLDLERAKAHKA